MKERYVNKSIGYRNPLIEDLWNEYINFNNVLVNKGKPIRFKTLFDTFEINNIVPITVDEGLLTGLYLEENR